MPGTDRKIVPEKVINKNGEEKGGLLAPVGDPLGRVVETGLKPVGSGVGALTGPVAEGAAKTTKPLMDAVGMGDRGEIKEQEKRKQEYKPLGGKPQTGENPLGL